MLKVCTLRRLICVAGILSQLSKPYMEPCHVYVYRYGQCMCYHEGYQLQNSCGPERKSERG